MRAPTETERDALLQQVTDSHSQLDEVLPYLSRRGVNRRTADRFKLGFDGERLTIPYLTPTGVWFIKRRCVADHDCKAERCSKYLNPEGANLRLYNAQTLLRADRVVITEGELDAVVVEQAGANCVGYPGAEAWKKSRHWRWCFDSVEEVIVVADGDPPEKNPRNKEKQPGDAGWVDRGVGEESGRAVVDVLRTSLPDLDVRLVLMPVGHDSNSFITEFGEIEYLSFTGWI